jgi:hypothetical protein
MLTRTTLRRARRIERRYRELEAGLSRPAICPYCATPPGEAHHDNCGLKAARGPEQEARTE